MSGFIHRIEVEYQIGMTSNVRSDADGWNPSCLKGSHAGRRIFEPYRFSCSHSQSTRSKQETFGVWLTVFYVLNCHTVIREGSQLRLI